MKNISKIKTINEKYKSDIKKSIDKFESEVDKIHLLYWSKMK